MNFYTCCILLTILYLICVFLAVYLWVVPVIVQYLFYHLSHISTFIYMKQYPYHLVCRSCTSTFNDKQL